MFKIKKIASLITSAAMIGSTVALAAAANYPAPFVSGGSPDVAIVYGSGNAAITDLVAANNIQTNLQTYVTSSGGTGSTGGTVSGGDFVKLERSSTKFHLGNGILDVVSGTLTDDDLSTILADGEYLDDDNTLHDYSQSMVLGNLSLTLFEDSDYKQDEPTVGIRIPSGNHILNYTLDFSDTPDWDDLANSDIEIMGKTYFISTVTTNETINLLDAAETTTLQSGESKTLNIGGTTYDVTIQVMDSNGVIFNVNGQTTNKIDTGQTYKLSSGAYIGVKELVIQNWQGGQQYVEFSIGSGKIELKDGSDVKINEDTINDLNVVIQSSNEQLESITLIWNAEDDLFITEESSVVMPGFENIMFSSGGMTYPHNEMFTVEGSSTYVRLTSFPMKEGNADINLLYGNGSLFEGVGRESTKILRTSASSSLTFDGDTDEYFVATYDDGTNAESYLMRATSFITDNGVNKTTIQSYSAGSWTNRKNEAKEGDTVNLGSVSLDIGAINKTDKTVAISAGNSVEFDKLYSKEGLLVLLPVANVSANYSLTGTPIWPQFMSNTSAAGYSAVTSYPLGFYEEDKNENKGDGKAFNATLSWNSDGKAHVSDVSGESPAGGEEIGDTDVLRSFIYGDLATELLHDIGGDQDSLDIVYHGAESYGNVFVTESGATVTPGQGSSGGGTTVAAPILDSEVSSVSNANLIVVGGSCVNSVAAELLGSSTPLCGNDFTASTGVGSGQFLIETFSRSGGNVATLVAGYNAGDTTNAATYLRTQTVMTDVGSKYTGTSATSASLVTS